MLRGRWSADLRDTQITYYLSPLSLSSSQDNLVRIWSTTTGETECKQRGDSVWVTSVAFSADGTRVTSASAAGSIQIWNDATGEVEHKLEGYSDWVYSVEARNKWVIIWNLGEHEHKPKAVFGQRVSLY
jgi:WD40 repeat protein